MKENYYNEDERQYLKMLQDEISRLSTHGANCKTWMVMIVAAILAVSCGIQDLNGWLLLTVIPILLFWYLDAFYLRLERGMRNRQRAFINMKNPSSSNSSLKTKLFDFQILAKDKGVSKEEIHQGFLATNKCYKAKSIRPFYLSALIIVLIISLVINFRNILMIFKSIAS